jgi:acetolactate synthase I/III small subunit
MAALTPASASAAGASATPAGRHHIVSALVENKFGVLARVSSLFSRRGYNIFSLAVAPTDDERFSRITIVVDVESAPLEQIVKQLDKLVNVVSISELAPEAAIERELVLVTVECDRSTRGEVMQLVAIFEARIVAVSAERMTMMLAGPPGKIDDFEELVRPFGIVELQRTGRVALPKLERPVALRSISGGPSDPAPSDGRARTNQQAG